MSLMITGFQYSVTDIDHNLPKFRAPSSLRRIRRAPGTKFPRATHVLVLVTHCLGSKPSNPGQTPVAPLDPSQRSKGSRLTQTTLRSTGGAGQFRLDEMRSVAEIPATIHQGFNATPYGVCHPRRSSHRTMLSRKNILGYTPAYSCCARTTTTHKSGGF